MDQVEEHLPPSPAQLLRLAHGLRLRVRAITDAEDIKQRDIRRIMLGHWAELAIKQMDEENLLRG